MKTPETHYVSADGHRIAYQQWGAGPCVLIIPGLISNMEIMWEHESTRRMLEHLGRYLTCVCFDKRGIGLSDRFEHIPTLEQRITDIGCVMDAVGWDCAHLYGISEGGMMAQLFAVKHPDRTESLTICNSTMSSKYRHLVRQNIEPNDPDLGDWETQKAQWAALVNNWPEAAKLWVDWFIPSQSRNESVIRWVGRLQRLSASPKDFRRQVDSVLRLDAGDAAQSIMTPTLVINVKGDLVVPVASGRVLASVIPKAKFVEIPGSDHFFWFMPNWREILDIAIEFITAKPVPRITVRRFSTVLFTDIVNSTKQSSAVGDSGWLATLEEHDQITRHVIDRHGGRVVKSTGDGLLAVFDLPSQAVSSGGAMLAELASIGISIRVGLHAGEIEVRDDGDIAGIAVNLAARVEQQAQAGELWVSSTLRDMMLGGSVVFQERGQFDLKGIEGSWRLYCVDNAANSV